MDRSYWFAVCTVCAAAYLAQANLEDHNGNLIPRAERLAEMSNASISASGANFWAV